MSSINQTNSCHHNLTNSQMPNSSFTTASRPPSIRNCSGGCRFSTVAVATPTMQNNSHLHPSLSQQNSYTGYDEDLHSNPGLRRSGIDATAIRQHFYPDGGWGWIICAVAFLAHVLTTGFQFSYGFLLLYAIKHLGQDVAMETGWIGAGSLAVSSISTIFIIALCRKKSTRVMAVVGGLVYALGILFTSFAKLFHQVAVSYCLVIGVGTSFVRESSAIMIENYFERRRMFVEMVVMSGEGVGVSLFSVIIKEGLGKLGWRYGLQVVTVLISSTFFMGMFYRPSSQYHPYRSTILHIKSQRKKMKVKKTHIQAPKPPFIDFAPIKSSSVQILCLIAGIGALGIYTPIFFLSLHGYNAGCDIQDLVLLQTLLGLSLAIGVIIFNSLLINKQCQIGTKKFVISHQHICQGCILLLSISLLILSTLPPTLHTLCIFSFFYGLGLGGYRLSIKMLTLERVKVRHFSQVWGFMKACEAIPILISIPLIGYLNEEFQSNGRIGYLICAAATVISALLLSFVGYSDIITRNGSKYLNVSGYEESSDNRSSFRFNSSEYSPRTSVSNGYSSNNFNNAQHSHQCPQSIQYNHNHNQINQNKPINVNGGCGKLQKSLSFWFQTPESQDMMNDVYNNYYKCQNSMKKVSNSPGSRSITNPSQRCIHHAAHHHNHQAGPHTTNLQVSRSRSVPDILAHASNQCPQFYRTQSRSTVHFLEKLTTKV